MTQTTRAQLEQLMREMANLRMQMADQQIELETLRNGNSTSSQASVRTVEDSVRDGDVNNDKL